ncbi:MAG: hypothetical protein Ct9H300mP4_17740 [Gammaproteobacteria bacterium]|nr:MAG: hypothetical protein Ct9H300mP4_17740 [Gammaproteobacteria bacterium]
MSPKETITNKILTMYLLDRSPQMSVLIVIENSMSNPPIVGVPSLTECDSGPFCLIDSPISLTLSFCINLGPRTKETKRAVSALNFPLVVI